MLSDFAWILGGLGPSKNWKKIEKIDFPTRSVLKEGSGTVLGRFWDGFGRILKGFWMDFNGIWGRFLKLFERIWKDKQWLGRPRERQEVLIIGRVVGWSGGVPKSLVCGDFRALGLDLHSLFFTLRFQEGFFSMLGRFREVFGGQNGIQNRFLGGFFPMFFSSVFLHRFWVVFWMVETWKIMKNRCFFNCFC